MFYLRSTLQLKTLSTAALAIGLSACTAYVPGSFRLAQQEQKFSSQLKVNTKIDLLWVVDNSSSMDVSQEKLRNGFSGFARKYMQPTWDIRVAVITTDTYLANPSFSNYLNRTIPGTTGWTSPYVNSRLASFANPASNPSLVNLSTGRFDAGVRYRDLVPAWGPDFSKLLPGNHDGPIAGFCFEALPYFLLGVTQCPVRDVAGAPTGAARCLRPESGDSSISQCVNTTQNDTIHSGRAVISTMPSGKLSEAELTAWTNRLVDDFMINVTTGSVGHGSERGLGSMLQLLDDNETSESAFFRPDSLRGIVFVSDEDDQTLSLDASPAADFNPYSSYRCDQASLVALNGAAPVTGSNGFCCSNPSNNCRFGAEGTSCAAKTVDGFTYTLSVCPREDKLMPVSEVKSRLDSFFAQLDGGTADTGSYFVVSIVAATGEAIQSLQASRDHDDTVAGGFHTFAVDRGDRYIELGNLVGNGSLTLNIADPDYSPILDAIGAAIIAKKSTFYLDRAPTGSEDMLIKVLHADGTSTVIPADKYVISGKTIVITDQNLVLSLAATDQISINYQPKTVY
ncbi:MAG: hypothetical protein NDJ89_10595 [Oligoflexia bacterium]|nr:hypothetical protein [Oligoflexia bacterium]